MNRDIRLWIEPQRCRACRRCLAARVCRVRAIVKMDMDEPPYIDLARCYDCRRCVTACPFGAVVVLRDGFDMARAPDQV